MVNLIIYKREPGILAKIQHANYVSNYAALHGLPARQSISPRIAQLQGVNSVAYASLYNYMPGTTIPWEAYTMKHLKQLGATMGKLHVTLKPLPRRNMPLIADENRALLKRMRDYFATDGVRTAVASKLGLSVTSTPQLQSAIDACAQLPAQALHMDFVRGNILFDNGVDGPAITGILDFEKTAWGSPLFDIARTLAFLLIDCRYKPEAKIRKYFVQSGYQKRGQNIFQASQLFENLIDFYLLHDFYKFLRHNPYESLEQNEHFVRTRDFLLKRNIIAPAGMLQ